MFHIDNLFIRFKNSCVYVRFGLDTQYFMIDSTGEICLVTNAEREYITDLSI